jgi:hypothetical protein
MEILCRSLYFDKYKPWRFELTHPVVLTLSDGSPLTIPAGYKTDFATVPLMLRGIVWGAGNHNLATLIHDYLYDTQDVRGRLWADKEMKHWLEKAGCSKIKVLAMYWAVRLGGQKWWDN